MNMTQRDIIKAHTAAAIKPKPSSSPQESVADFLARGGEIEQLPTHYSEPTSYPRGSHSPRAKAAQP
jgi:hypothetical protein